MTLLSDLAFDLGPEAERRGMNGMDIERIVIDLMKFEIDAKEELRAIAPTRAPACVHAAIEIERQTEAALRSALTYGDYRPVATQVSQALAWLRVHVEPETDNWRRLARLAARGLLEVCEENLRRERGIYRTDALLPRALALTPAQAPADAPVAHAPLPAPIPTQILAAAFQPAELAIPAPAAAPAPILATAPATAETPVLRLNDLHARFCAKKIEDCAGWAKSSKPNADSIMKMVVGVFGDAPVDSFKTEELKEFFGIVEQLPNAHHKAAGEDYDIRKLLAQTEAAQERPTRRRRPHRRAKTFPAASATRSCAPPRSAAFRQRRSCATEAISNWISCRGQRHLLVRDQPDEGP